MTTPSASDSERLERIERTINALYEWTQEVDKGIRSAQQSGGMTGMMMKGLFPPGIPPLPGLFPPMPQNNR